MAPFVSRIETFKSQPKKAANCANVSLTGQLDSPDNMPAPVFQLAKLMLVHKEMISLL